MRQDSNREWIRALGSISSIGFLILISVGVGLVIGLWLDKKFDTSPWLTFVFTLIGLAAGLYESIKLLLKV